MDPVAMAYAAAYNRIRDIFKHPIQYFDQILRNWDMNELLTNAEQDLIALKSQGDLDYLEGRLRSCLWQAIHDNSDLEYPSMAIPIKGLEEMISRVVKGGPNILREKIPDLP